MMAAGRAAELGAKVMLIEKNPELGRKLLLTGGGRCNVTNAEFDDRVLLEHFKENGKCLFSTFSQWSVKESLAFFNSRGMETKVENEKRVFPASNSSKSVLNVLLAYIKQGGVVIRANSPVRSVTTLEAPHANLSGSVERNASTALNSNVRRSSRAVKAITSDEVFPDHNDADDADQNNGAITSNTQFSEKSGNDQKIVTSVILENGDRIFAKSFILATGGKSYPQTGSTGDGFAWLSKLGHKIVKADSALVPMNIRDRWVKALQGLTLPDIKIAIFQDSKKVEAKRGKILFTHFGVSGPTIINMSRKVNELLAYGDVFISLDIVPNLAFDTLNSSLQDLFKKHSNKMFKNALPLLVPATLAPIVTEMSGIDGDTFCHSITREERVRLMSTLKDMRMQVDSLMSPENAIVASGGIDLAEVDSKTMRSKLVPNLYVTGDILNINRPSGGFSLQLCWTTGFVAGTWAAQ